MQFPYRFDEIIPVRVTTDEDGDTHATYDLPAPKRWQFTRWLGDLESSCVPDHYTVQVSRVRVICRVDGETAERKASAVPYDEQGKESPANAVHFKGVASVVGVLSRLGFSPALPLN